MLKIKCYKKYNSNLMMILFSITKRNKKFYFKMAIITIKKTKEKELFNKYNSIVFFYLKSFSPDIFTIFSFKCTIFSRIYSYKDIFFCSGQVHIMTNDYDSYYSPPIPKINFRPNTTNLDVSNYRLGLGVNFDCLSCFSPASSLL